MDHDIVTYNDFGGECFVFFKDITTIGDDNSSTTTHADTPEINVKITLPQTSGQMFTLLNDRSPTDQNAAQFVELRQKVCNAAEEVQNKIIPKP